MGFDFKKRKNELLEKHEAVLICTFAQFEPNFHYLTGASVDGSYYLLTRDSETIITSRMAREYAEYQGFGAIVTPPPSSANKNKSRALAETVSKILKKKHISTLAVEVDKLGTRNRLALRRFGKLKLVNASETLLLQRMVKDNEEIRLIRKAVQLAKQALKELELGGKSERQAYFWLLEFFSRNHANIAFEPIVAFGIHTTFPHSVPTDTRKGRLPALIDLGARWRNYCSDLTECYIPGNCKPELATYEEVKNIFYDIIDNSPDFRNTKDVNEFAKSCFRKRKLPELPHSLGHGVGLQVHEYPNFRRIKPMRLLPGMVLAIEPAAYGLDGGNGKFGVRYERTVLVGKKGFREL